MDIDLYSFFGLSFDCSQKDIKKAYKLKAKEVHPDKNATDPHAKEAFQQLKVYYEILLDPVSKNEYDRKWKAKREAEKRYEAMDASRKKMKEELEAREAAAMAAREKQRKATAQATVADQIRREWQLQTERIHWEAQKRRGAEATNDITYSKLSKSSHTLVKVKWSASENPTASACYTESFLKTCLSEFGDVVTLVVGKRGTAVAEFSSHSDAMKTIEASRNGSVGLPTLPLLVTLVGKSDSTKDPSSVVPEVHQKTEDAPDEASKPQTSFTSFESDILARMASFGQ